MGEKIKMSSRVAERRYSRSRSRSPRYTARYSRSRSRSYSPRGGRGPPGGGGGRGGRYGGGGDRGPGPSRRRGSRSRSPMSDRRRHVGSREAPTESSCLGVFGLSMYTTEKELESEFSKFGPLEKVQVILDGKSGRSRGFAFVYYEAQEDAKAAKDAMCDQEIDGRRIRVGFSITKRPHTPTPGVYMGRPTYRGGGGGGGGGYRGGDGGGRYDRGYGGGGGGYGSRRRSPSPYYRGGGGGRDRRDYRSRSRSYSPRRY